MMEKRPSRRDVRRARKQVALLQIQREIHENRARLSELQKAQECDYCTAARGSS